jgi:phage terminase Nu1 subunit (DNA packaging protein)
MKRAQEEAELDAGIDERGDGLERYRAARADRAELEVAQMRGELVSKSDVEARWGRVLSHLVQAFDGMGKVLAPRLAMRHEKEIAQTVRDEVRHTIESARAMMLADEEL